MIDPLLAISRHVDTSFLKRGCPHPKIGIVSKSNAKRVHIELALQEWMHAKYDKILFSLGGCVHSPPRRAPKVRPPRCMRYVTIKYSS